MKFSMIIPAYREENLEVLIDSIVSQTLETDMKLEKIVVVACDCKNLNSVKRNKVEILEETIRKGKAHSINLAMKRIPSEIIVLESSDTLPEKDTIQNLLKPFKDNPKLGMTVSRPVPMNDENTFTGYVIHLIWNLHHIISETSPKGGELIAFRNEVKHIPDELATDESYIEFMIRKLGYEIKYAPDAIVYNEGPKSLSNLIKQRRRIFNGHLHVRDEYGYSVSTMNASKILTKLLEFFKSESNSKKRLWIIGAVIIEAWARSLATIDFYLLKKLPYKWEVVK